MLLSKAQIMAGLKQAAVTFLKGNTQCFKSEMIRKAMPNQAAAQITDVIRMVTAKGIFLPVRLSRF